MPYISKVCYGIDFFPYVSGGLIWLAEQNIAIWWGEKLF